MENEEIAENILRDKCRCAKQKALSGVNHICFVCEFTKALNAKDAEIARLDQYIEELIDKNDSLSSQVAKYRKILEFIANHCTKDYTREIERPEFNAMMEGIYSQAKQALEDTPVNE